MNAADTPAFLTATGAPADVEKAMFARFSAATGLHNVVSNTIRKSATTNYLNDPVEKHNEASTMDHGAKTATEHYDQGGTGQKVGRSLV